MLSASQKLNEFRRAYGEVPVRLKQMSSNKSV